MYLYETYWVLVCANSVTLYTGLHVHPIIFSYIHVEIINSSDCISNLYMRNTKILLYIHNSSGHGKCTKILFHSKCYRLTLGHNKVRISNFSSLGDQEGGVTRAKYSTWMNTGTRKWAWKAWISMLVYRFYAYMFSQHTGWLEEGYLQYK